MMNCLRTNCLRAAAVGLAVCVTAQIGPTSAKDLTIAGGVDPVGLNGIDVVILTPDRALVDHLADTLVRFEKPGKIVPSLATSWKLIDDTTWQIKLRRGVKFHNGEPFDAESVKFTVETITDKKIKARTARNYGFIKKVEIVDSHTVNVITNGPFPITLNNLSQLHMLPPRLIREKGLGAYRRTPIGTGPYRFAEHVKDDHVTLVANKDHWRGAPEIDRIIYRPIKEAATRVGALLAGEVDIIVNVPPEMIPDIEKSARAEVKSVPSARVFLMGMSNLDPKLPTANVKVREAINYAIDRDSLNQNIFGGHGAPASWINPDTFGFDDSIKPIKPDLARARKLLAEAGYPNGFSVKLDTPNGRYLKDKELAEAISGQLAKVGIRVEPRAYEWGVLTKRIFGHRTSPLILYAWGDPKGDPNSSNNLTLKTRGLFSQFTDKGLDKLMAEVDTIVDVDKRRAMVHAEQRMLRELYPFAYLVQLADIYGVRKGLDWKPRSDEVIWLYSKAP